MIKILASPGRYIQGPGAIGHLGAHAGKLGKKALVLITKAGMGRVGKAIEKSFEEEGLAYSFT